MVNKDRIYLSPPHLGGREAEFIQDAFDSNWIAPLGPHVDAFEKEMCEYLGLKYSVALSSGTAALHLALKNLNISEGDYVFCSDLTFVASANAIVYEKAVPVFIDSDEETWTMSPTALERAFDTFSKENKKPKAVIVVDLYGQSANYDILSDICKKYQVPLIEDAAESLGAEYKSKKCGNFGDMAVLSFNGNKIITTSGGGMLLSNNEQYIEKARYLATQARDPAVHYEHSRIGYNYRMSNILAAIGRGQLLVLDERIKQKRKIFQGYVNGLASRKNVHFMPEADYGLSTRWLTALTLNSTNSSSDPKAIIQALDEHNIEARPIWKPMHLQPIFKGRKYFTRSKGKSISSALFKNGICLPSGSNLSRRDQEKIVQIVKKNV